MACVFSPLAASDLEELGDYIARDNPARAVSFVKEIRTRCSKIEAMPLAAPLRPELGEDFRVVILGKYLIFYRLEAQDVRIERILHGARDLLTLFGAD